MIYLVSMLKDSYAKREMDYTRQFLNKQCKKTVAMCIDNIESLERICDMCDHDDDWVVVADYKSHPLYWENVTKTDYGRWDRAFNKINHDKIVVWLGDARFNCIWPDVKYAIGSYMTTFHNCDDRDYRGFKACFANDIIPISWKHMLPQLRYNFSLAETQVYWGDFQLQDKEYDLTYIINGAIKYRAKQFDWINDLRSVSLQLGAWSSRSEPHMKDFVATHDNATYVTDKVYGKEWLELISKGRYTIIADDDNKQFPAMLSARFWEAVRAGVIPLIHIVKDTTREIYKGFDALRTVAYFYDAADLQRILLMRPYYERCLKELVAMERFYIRGEV